jgi:rhodanese-related sulfurtransferase
MFFYNNYQCLNIGPNELEVMRRAGNEFLLLDVRTPQENAADAIEGSYLIPVQELGHRLQELPRDKEIVVYCKVGNRSAYACAFLAQNGYNVKNLEGGIMLWNLSGYAAVSKA